MTVTEPIQSFTDGDAYSLDKLNLPDAHIVNGREFPVAYQLNLHGNPYDTTKVEALLARFSQSGTFTKLQEDHGSVVLRGLVKDSDTSKAPYIAELISIVEENRGFVEFEQNGTRAIRSKVGKNLYVANDLTPKGDRMLQHNEYSRFKTWPSTINFTIPEYTAEGGETPIVHGGELFLKLQKELPDFLKKLSRVGLKFQDEVWPLGTDTVKGIVWNDEVTFGRDIKPEDDLETQKKKAEAVSRKYVSENLRWSDNNDLIISSLSKAVKKFKGEPLIFTSLAAYADEYGTQQVKDPKIKYGDGQHFTTEELTKFKQLVDEVEYVHSWESGDIVFIHNYQVSHGKFPYKNGLRRILVGMWDEKVPDKKNLFVDYTL